MNRPQLVHSARPAVQRDRLLRLPEVESIAGVRKSTIYALMKDGRFPPCVQLTPRCVAWPETSVLSWVQDRINEARATRHPDGSALSQTERLEMAASMHGKPAASDEGEA